MKHRARQREFGFVNWGGKHGCWRALFPDVYSSGPAFEGWKAEVAVSTGRILARARTWLLSIGWKKRGHRPEGGARRKFLSLQSP